MGQTVDPNNEGRAKEETGKEEDSENPSDTRGFTGWEPDEENITDDKTPRHQPVNQQDDQ